MEQVQKKGMSRGCLVAIIVGGVLLLLIIIAAVTCYVKRDDLAKFGATTVISGLKTELRQHPIQGIDSTRLFTLTDAFVAKFGSDSLDYSRYSRLMNVINGIMGDKKLDSSEVGTLSEAMIDYYPELAPLWNPVLESGDQPTAVPDSAAPTVPDSGK